MYAGYLDVDSRTDRIRGESISTKEQYGYQALRLHRLPQRVQATLPAVPRSSDHQEVQDPQERNAGGAPHLGARASQ